MDIPSVSSRIATVTAYRQGARIHRVAELRAANGAFPAQIRLTHLPLAMDDGSLKVKLSGGNGALPVASDLRVTLEVPPPDPALAPVEDSALRGTRVELEKLRDQLEQNRSEMARLDTILIPSRGKEKDKAPLPTPTDARVKLLEFRLERMEALLKQRDALEKQYLDTGRTLRDLEAKNAAATTARQPREHQLRKAVIVSLRASENGASSKSAETAQLELEYLIPGARWAPAYTFRFDRDFTKAELSMRALVAQKTGEDWSSAKLVLSTANAQGWTELEELSSLRIGRRQPPPVKRGWRAAPEGAGELYGDYDRYVTQESRRAQTAIITNDRVGGDVAVARESVAAIRIPHEDRTSAMSVTGDMTVLEAGGGVPSDTNIGQITLDAEMVQRDELETSRKVQYKTARPAPPPPAQAPAAAPAMMRMLRASVVPGSAMRAPPEALDLSSETTILGRELSPSDQMLDYGRLRMPPPGAPRRGKLEHISDDALYVEVLSQMKVEVSFSVSAVILQAISLARGVEHRSPPHRCRFPEALDGFDYAYQAPAPVDIPSDGEFHSIPLVCEAADARAHFVCVPREALDVFRFAEIKNPLGAPLLEGPADIHAGGDFLMTTTLHTVPPHGYIQLGLGVEQAIKVARNTSYAEDAAGIIGGSLDLKHELKIDIISHLKNAVHVEVRERIPVLREGEDQARLSVAQVTPEWEALKPESLRPGEEGLKGGYRWLTPVEPGKPRQLKAAYVVQISAKNELAGGNRRES
jgi:hypothetical protein